MSSIVHPSILYHIKFFMFRFSMFNRLTSRKLIVMSVTLSTNSKNSKKNGILKVIITVTVLKMEQFCFKLQ